MSELLSFVLCHIDQFRRARLPSLYSDFKVQQHTNPDGYTANVAAWEEALQKAARAGLLYGPSDAHDTLSLMTGEGLLQSLETKEWGRPLALDAVIDEAISKRHMIPIEEFISSPTGIYNLKWAPWLFSWGLQQLGLSRSAPKNERSRDVRLVILLNVEEAARKVIAKMSYKGNQVDRIHSLDSFRKEVAQAINNKDGLTDDDLNVLLRYLARDRRAIVYDHEIVKFKGPPEESLTISGQDRTIASLKSLIANLKQQVASITTRVNSLSENAQRAVIINNRVSALAALRLRKAAEAALAQRLDTLSQLEGLYDRIEQAVDQVTMVRVMEASTGVLQNLHAEVGGITNVENIVEKLREEMDKVDEIGNAIEVAGRGDAAVDESGIDDDLEALVRQDQLETEKEVQRTQQRLANLEAPRDAQETPQLPSQETNTEPMLHQTNAASSIDTFGVDAFDRMSLDERHASNPEISQTQPKVAKALPSGVPEG